MDYELKKLKMLAQGGEAVIYDIGDGKIIRVLRVAGRQQFETEKILYPLLQKNNINVPEIYDYAEIEGRSAQIMQNINGNDMLEYLEHHPFCMNKLVKKLADMHTEVLNIEADSRMNTIKDKINYFLSRSLPTDKKLADFVIKLLEELPDKSNVCHGDFHPGNILMQNGKYYIIDWSGAYIGDSLSDIAHSYLIMKLVPFMPGHRKVQHAFIRFAGSLMAKSYLKQMSELKSFDFELFSKWTVVISFLRLYYKLPLEEQGRISYMRKCYELNLQGKSAALWYKNI
jgi:tRNA A-37 threonylcarbamoyl transferase component Bud32